MGRSDNHTFFFLEDSGSIDMTVNGSVTPVMFEYTVTSPRFDWVRNVIRIQDAGINATGFGGLAALTSGVKIEIINSDGSVQKDFTAQRTITEHSMFGSFAGVDLDRDATPGDDVLLVRWTINKGVENSTSPSAIELRKDEIIRVTVQDDLSAMSAMDWMIQGYDHSGAT